MAGYQYLMPTASHTSLAGHQYLMPMASHTSLPRLILLVVHLVALLDRLVLGVEHSGLVLVG